jgi:hypothetical protein
MKQEVMKEAYKIPRIAIRGIVLESVIALDSYYPTISGEVNYLEYDNVYTEVKTQNEKDVLIF